MTPVVTTGLMQQDDSKRRARSRSLLRDQVCADLSRLPHGRRDGRPRSHSGLRWRCRPASGADHRIISRWLRRQAAMSVRESGRPRGMGARDGGHHMRSCARAEWGTRELITYVRDIGVHLVSEQWNAELGSAMMRPTLDRCDRDGLPAYIEASSGAAPRGTRRRIRALRSRLGARHASLSCDLQVRAG